MRVELQPAQPEPVVRAIERLLEGDEPAVDPWWASAVEEALRGGDGPAPEDAGGVARVVEA